jgi:hypothetical protein
MTRLVKIFLFLSLLILPEMTWAEEVFEYDGDLTQTTAYRVGDPKNFSMIKQMARLNLQFNFNEHLKMRIGGRAWYDAVYDLTDQFPQSVNDNMRKELVPRDVYLDILTDKVNIRLGHQQIVWGESLSQFFADVVNPRDLRYFLIPDHEYIRSQIWALDVRYFFAPNATWEVVVSPDQSVDKVAPQGADFAFRIPPPPPGFTQTLLPANRPSTDFTSWNVGTRFTLLVKGWDLAWLFYTSPDLFPTLFKTVVVNPTTGVPDIQLTANNPRVYNYGFTFSKGIRSSVLRGEFVVTQGRFFDANDVFMSQGVVKKNNLRYMLGFDTNLGGKVDMNVEFQQSVIFGETNNLAVPAVDEWIVMHFETGFFDQKLIPEISFAVGLRLGDTYIAPRINYFVIPSVRLTWGADVFTGSQEGLYGEFSHASRVLMETEWSF